VRLVVSTADVIQSYRIVWSLTGLGHAHGTLACRHAVHVAVRSDAHGGRHRQTRACCHLDCPLHLLDVLEVLEFSAYNNNGVCWYIG